MKSSDRKKIKDILLVKERFKVFYKQSYNSAKSALDYGRVDLRRKINAIENLFAPYETEGKKKKTFNIAISSVQYREFKKLSEGFTYYKNKELKKALKDIDSIYDKQKFRNTEVTRLILERFDRYVKDLEKNKSLQKLCRTRYCVGPKAKIYRKKRLDEAYAFQKEIRLLQTTVKEFSFVNDIESCIRLYIDFFTIALQRLELFNEIISETLNKYLESIEIRALEQQQGKHLNLRAPS